MIGANHAGGVIRDHDYMRNVRKGVVLQTWGLLSGFQIAKEFDIEHIIVESDSVVLITLIHSSDLELHPLGLFYRIARRLWIALALVRCCIFIGSKTWLLIPWLKKSLDNELGLCVLQVMPDFVTSTILDDMAGIVRLQSIHATPAVV